MTISSIARRLNFASSAPSLLPAVILVTDEARLADPLSVIETLPRGTGVLLRHYGVPHRAELARKTAALCRRQNLALLLAGDPELAFAVNADGLHLPEFLVQNPPPKALTWRHRRGKILTAAAHNPGALFRAADIGADAALLSPVNLTKSHPERTAIGILRFASWARAVPTPVYAMGGISEKNARRLSNTGAIGIAGVGDVAAEFNQHNSMVKTS